MELFPGEYLIIGVLVLLILADVYGRVESRRRWAEMRREGFEVEVTGD